MKPRRHVVPALAGGWIITNSEGQHTAHINGTRKQVLACAQQQLADFGGGQVTIDEDDDA